MSRIKQFLKFKWSKVILTILLFLVHPEPVFRLGGTGPKWQWFASIEILKNLGNILLRPFKWIGSEYFIEELFSSLGLFLLLLGFIFIFYLISCFIIWILKKIKNLF